VEVVVVLGVREDEAEEVVWTGRGEVEDRLGDGGDGEAFVGRSLEPTPAVNADLPTVSDTPRGADMDLPRGVLEQSEPLGGRDMAEHRARARVEERCREVGFG
jgi:hypothetical protein